MGHSEDILKLRKRVADAVATGVVDPNLKDFYEATLLQVLNEAERQRQTCATQAEALRKQAAIADGQASAYSAMGSIVYSVLNGYILQAEKAIREEHARAAEMAEKKAYAESLKQEEPVVKEVAAPIVVDEVKEEVQEEVAETRTRRPRKR